MESGKERSGTVKPYSASADFCGFLKRLGLYERYKSQLEHRHQAVDPLSPTTLKAFLETTLPVHYLDHAFVWTGKTNWLDVNVRWRQHYAETIENLKKTNEQ